MPCSLARSFAHSHPTTRAAARPSSFLSVGAGLSEAMLDEPKAVKLVRAPTYLDPAQRAKHNMVRQVDTQREREASLAKRRQDIIGALVPQFK